MGVDDATGPLSVESMMARLSGDAPLATLTDVELPPAGDTESFTSVAAPFEPAPGRAATPTPIDPPTVVSATELLSVLP